MRDVGPFSIVEIEVVCHMLPRTAVVFVWGEKRTLRKIMIFSGETMNRACLM
jgi:hypothetical protein